MKQFVLILMMLLLSACASVDSSLCVRSPGDGEVVCGERQREFTGTITGYSYDSYFIDGIKGATLLPVIDDSDKNLQLFIYQPEHVDFYDGDRYTFPETGQYELRVLQPRAFARRGRVVGYRLQLNLVNP